LTLRNLSINIKNISILNMKLNKVKDKPNDIKEMKTCQCGSEINIRTTMCEKCWSIKNRKVEIPPFNQLLSEVREMGYSGTGRKYGVSDNPIRMWLSSFNPDSLLARISDLTYKQ